MMKTCSSIVFAFLWWHITLSEQQQQGFPEDDPCNNFDPVPDINRRAIDYVPSGEEKHVNDYFRRRGWYGTEGYDMVMESPPKGQVACGTPTPIYLQLEGDLPSNIGDTATGTACIVGWFTDCILTFDIDIKHCKDNLNIYEMSPTTVVNSAYCFNRTGEVETIAPAPDFSPASINVDVDLFWTDPVQIGNGPTEIQMPKLLFSCSFQPMPGNLLYQVSWFVNGEFKISKGPVTKDNVKQLAITEDELSDMGTTTLGFTIKCGLIAYADMNGLPGNMTTSRGFFAGFKVKDTRITIERSSENNSIEFESTVPLGCANVINGPQRPCDVYLELYHFTAEDGRCDRGLAIAGDNTLTGKIADASQCSLPLKGIRIDDVEIRKNGWTENYFWPIIQTDDADYKLQERENHFIIKLKVSFSILQHKIWIGYQLDDINVLVTDKTSDWQSKTCRVLCDPHMTTFDGVSYEMQKPGVFTLYKHKLLPVEVQIRSELCVIGVQNAHCPCGIYVRGGSDLFIISTCEDYPFINFYGNCGDRSLQVIRKGDTEYKIILPTGATVSVMMGYGWNLNIYIYAAPRDKDNVEGLCGNLNGDRTDDFHVHGKDYGDITICGGGRFECRNDFVDLYNVPEEKKFFPRTEKNSNLIDNLERFTILQAQCMCAVREDGVNRNECNSKQYVKCPEGEKEIGCKIKQSKRKRKRRDISVDDLGLKSHMMKLSNAIKRSKRSATKISITEEQARLICQSKFDGSGSYQYCESNVEGIASTQEVKNCVYDLNVTGITDWAQDALNSVTSQCVREADKNNTLQETSEGKKSVAEVIKELTCPSECSGNGICFNGSCHCNDTFGGSDCSFEIQIPPTVYHNVGEDICDTSTTDCDYIDIFGDRFIDSINLTCKITEIKISTKGSVVDKITQAVAGDARSPFEVRCPLTAFAQTSTNVFFKRYSFNIANDGRLYGTTEKTVFVADTTCQEYIDNSSVFQLQDGYCFIEAECWSAGKNKENDIQQVCIPQNNTFQWTFIPNAVPKSTEPCDIVKGIPDLSKRETYNKYIINLDDIQVDDVGLEEGWYGEDSYDMLRTPASSGGGCGSLRPIWLQGNLPTVDGNVTYGSGCVTGLIENCINEIPIEIKRCNSTFNIYYLKPTEIVFSSYCFSLNKITTEAATTKTKTDETTTTQRIESSSTISKSSLKSITTQSLTSASVSKTESAVKSTQTTDKSSAASRATSQITSKSVTSAKSTIKSTSTTDQPSSKGTTGPGLTSNSVSKSKSTTSTRTTDQPSSKTTTRPDSTSSSVTKAKSTTKSTSTTDQNPSKSTTRPGVTPISMESTESKVVSTQTIANTSTKSTTRQHFIYSTVTNGESTTTSQDFRTTTDRSIGSNTGEASQGELLLIVGFAVGVVVLIGEQLL